MNELFGFDRHYEIPFVIIDNPFSFLAKAKKNLKLRDSSDAKIISTLDALMRQFQYSTRELDKFFGYL